MSRWSWKKTWKDRGKSWKNHGIWFSETAGNLENVNLKMFQFLAHIVDVAAGGSRDACLWQPNIKHGWTQESGRLWWLHGPGPYNQVNIASHLFNIRPQTLYSTDDERSDGLKLCLTRKKYKGFFYFFNFSSDMTVIWLLFLHNW